MSHPPTLPTRIPARKSPRCSRHPSFRITAKRSAGSRAIRRQRSRATSAPPAAKATGWGPSATRSPRAPRCCSGRSPPAPSRTRCGGRRARGYALAKSAGVLFGALAACALAYARGWAARMLPRSGAPAAEPYRAPASLFGMELAPEKLPSDVAAAALALARAGKVREALGLLYRGALSDLVHRRSVELLASHTEAEALAGACTQLTVPGSL